MESSSSSRPHASQFANTPAPALTVATTADAPPPPLPRPPPPPRSALVGTPITASRNSFRLTPSYLTWLHPRTGFPCAHNRKGGGVEDGRKGECKLGECGMAQW